MLVDNLISLMAFIRKVFFKILISWSSPIIRVFERKILVKKLDSRFQPIFIIGAPRTGSTILYQAITNYIDLMYIDNLTCKLNKNLLFGLWLSRKITKGVAHNNFEAEHGSTKKYGNTSPSECGAFWYRWLPHEYHYISDADITPEMTNEIRSEISAAINYFDRPLIFKNLNAGQRLRLIHKAFPDAKFIYLKRDPRFVIRSILKARERKNVGNNEWWSVMPSNYKELFILPEPEMVAAQVYYIERQIEDDLRLFPDENIQKIHYQSLSMETIKGLKSWININQLEGGRLPSFRKDEVSSLSEKELTDLTKVAKKYPFPDKQYI